MPFEPNRNLRPPSDPHARAWRCIDFAKFVHLISSRELYFCNLKVLARNDPHEGLLANADHCLITLNIKSKNARLERSPRQPL